MTKLHPLPLPLSSCLGCIPPLIGLPSLRFYAVGSSLFLLSVCFCLCSLFYRDDVLCWLLLARPFLYAFHAHLRFPVDLVWFRLSCDHGWIRSGSVNVRKQQQQQQLFYILESRALRTISICAVGETFCGALGTAVAVFAHRMCTVWCKSLSQPPKCSSLTPHEAPELAKLQAESYVGVR